MLAYLWGIETYYAKHGGEYLLYQMSTYELKRVSWRLYNPLYPYVGLPEGETALIERSL